jgi:transposase
MCNTTKEMRKKFKDYNQGQMQLLPPNLEELIEPGHLSRVINEFINQIDHSQLYDAFPGGGTTSYNPLMILKVLIYAYCTKTFSSRDIERNMKQDIVYMWLSGMQRPDHNTINRFRSDYLSIVLDEIFFQVVWMLKEKGYLNLDDLFVDGTKLEANAGRYTYVWRKNTERYKANVKKKIELLLEEINNINAQEDQDLDSQPSEELTIGNDISPSEIEQAASKASTAIKKKIKEEPDKKTAALLKKKKRELEECQEKLNKYELQEKILDGRNSYSKTDNDATFMRTKDDALRPCYNPIISTNNQFIVNVTLSQNAADNVGFIEHANKLTGWNNGALKPLVYVGDSGFGNEENYEYLSEEGINNYLKFNTFHYENTPGYRGNIFLPENMPYDPQHDSYTCPSGRKISHSGNVQRVTATGYIMNAQIYECENCRDCSLATKCKKNEGNRRFSRSIKLEGHKEKARENLNSKQGIELRRQRGPDVETPFADIKQNMEFRRFRLRRIEKTTVEMLWVSLAHNMRKVAVKRKKAA